MSKPIYVLCLHNVRTGGPEAIHQLSDALIEQGFDARMVYYDWGQIAALEQASPDDFYVFGPRENPIEEYARYKTRIGGTVPNQNGYIIVLPETLCHLAPKFPNATVLIWWLSVDNGFGALSRVNLNHLRKANVRHAWQSQYAEELVRALGFDRAGPLSDYTVDLRALIPDHELVDAEERDKLAVFNANHKVTADLDAIFAAVTALEPDAKCQRIVGMSRAEVAKLLATARLYVDLGSMPGKDRAPREAADLGCAVLLGQAPASETDFDDAFDRVNSFNVDAVTEAVVSQLADPVVWGWACKGERKQFFAETRALFSEL